MNRIIAIICKCLAANVLLLMVMPAGAGLLDSMEKTLMPGPLHQAHAKYEDDCDACHKLFSKEQQNDMCLDCHDHKNVAEDIRAKQGFHGRIAGVEKKSCKLCHAEHKGRKASLVLLERETFDHSQTDYALRGRHRDTPCQACHKDGDAYYKAPQQCLACHKDIDPHQGQLGERCESCHGESRWLDFRFDHGQTKFKLEGKHQGVECRACHPKQHYRGVTKDCYGCHRGDDRHRGGFGEKCQDCHAVTGWAQQRFDHDKDTDFKLTGRHKPLQCQQCHPANVAKKKIAAECYACHRLQDEHKGLYGRKCHDCHSSKGWREVTFDHAKTDFALKGKHEKVACGDCHVGKLGQEKLPKDCFGCHRSHDIHQGQQGKQCQDCHNEKSWTERVTFDHNLVKFPLLGAHASLACEECHDSGSFKDAKSKCVSCHKNDDIHRLRLGTDCGNCHYVGDWKIWSFDHDKQTKFELKGAHRGITCHACHREPVQDNKLDLPMDCYYCHVKDDAHDGGFGRRCGRCHGVESFSDIRM